MESLTAFCKRNNLPKSSVRKVLLSQGHDTANGLSDEAIKFATAYFSRLRRQRKMAADYEQIDVPERLQEVNSKILLAEVKKLCYGISHETEMLRLKVEKLELIIDNQQELIHNLEYQLSRDANTSDTTSSPFIPNPWETGAA